MIPKPLGIAGLAIATSTVLSVAGQDAAAQVESNYTCFFINESGQVINLEPICGEPEIAAGSEDDDADAGRAFLDAFTETASSESLAIAAVIGDENVLALGESMCDFLATGAGPDDLATVFSATSLPPIFIQDVSAAATSNLCNVSPVEGATDVVNRSDNLPRLYERDQAEDAPVDVDVPVNVDIPTSVPVDVNVPVDVPADAPVDGRVDL